MRRPSPEELDRERARLRAQLDQRTAAARARVAQQRARLAAQPRQPRQQRRRWGPLLGLLVLLLALLLLCSGVVQCDPPPEPAAGEPLPPAPAVSAEETRGSGGAAVPRLATSPRPRFPALAPPAVPWLDAFRLQVAARGPRLAACFVGADHPGTLRWTAAVEPLSGRVSQAELEPLLDSVALTVAQDACVKGVLEDPTYRLEGGGDQGAPTRISLVLEF